MSEKKPRGGARKGAGRKPTDDPVVKVTITLKRALRDKFLSLGGSKWLAVKVAKARLEEKDLG
jgi:hypothetical protein